MPNYIKILLQPYELGSAKNSTAIPWLQVPMLSLPRGIGLYTHCLLAHSLLYHSGQPCDMTTITTGAYISVYSYGAYVWGFFSLRSPYWGKLGLRLTTRFLRKLECFLLVSCLLIYDVRDSLRDWNLFPYLYLYCLLISLDMSLPPAYDYITQGERSNH